MNAIPPNVSPISHAASVSPAAHPGWPTDGPGWSERVYGALVWLLPGPFRREYGDAMRQTFADLCAARGPAVLGVLSLLFAGMVGRRA